MEVPRKLWEHPDPMSTNMYWFMQKVNQKRGLKLKVGREVVYTNLEICSLRDTQSPHELCL